MAKVPVNNFLLLSKRACTVAADNVGANTVAAATRKAAECVSKEAPVAAPGEKEVFWMRDPKTGNWIPESNFDEVDVAELREKHLPKNA